MQPKGRTWNIRESVPADYEEIGNLFSTVFGFDRPIAHSHWKFSNNPSGAGIGMVAVDSGRIVGQYVLIPIKLRLGGEVVLGAQSLDTMTHPNYRKQGMFVQLAKACYDLAAKKGVEALYGFPNADSYWGFINDLNWGHVCNVPCWVRFVRSGSLSSIPDSLRSIGALAIRARALVLPKGNDSPHGVEIRLSPLPEMDAELLLQDWQQSEGKCRVLRSVDWFRWRFDRESQTDYQWATAFREGTARAWAVWGIRKWGKPAAMIDLLGRDTEALEAVASTAVRQALRSDLSHLLAITNAPLHIKALKACGFIQRGSIPLIVRSMTARNLNGNIHDPSSWRIYSADTDTF